MGRSILDNNFLAWEASEWFVESDQNLLLLLDFEKKQKWMGFPLLVLGKVGILFKMDSMGLIS